MIGKLREKILRFTNGVEPGERTKAFEAVWATLRSLEEGKVRAAEPTGGNWVVNRWVKEAILLAFRLGEIVPYPDAGALSFSDKENLPPRRASSLPPGRMTG